MNNLQSGWRLFSNIFSGINHDHGGWLSEPLNVNCGIWYGCPFSLLVSVLAVKTLAIKIRNSSIKGIKLPKLKDLQINIKCRQLADGTSLFWRDKNDINTATNVIQEFYPFSGLKLNYHRTQMKDLTSYPARYRYFVENCGQNKGFGCYFLKWKKSCWHKWKLDR